MSERDLPLAGVRVVEITEVWAGPMACSLLGDLGADVIKVESFPRSSITRPSQPGPTTMGYADGDTSGRFYDKQAMHHMANRNKRGVAVNIARTEGAEILKRLVSTADVYVEGYSAGTIDKMGLGYDVMRQVNPDLIMISMPGWGQHGPYRGLVTLGSGLDAASGHLALRGYRHATPLDAPSIYHSDATAACFAAFLAVAAVRYRRRTGRGQYIDLSQAETLFAHLARPFLQYQLTGHVPGPGGNDHPDYVAQGCYPVAGEDAWIAITVRNAADWRALCELVPSLTDLPMPQPTGMVNPRDDLAAVDAAVAAWTREYTAQEACNLLQARGIPAMPVHDEEGTFGDPHFRARGLFKRVAHPVAGLRTMVGPLFRFSRTALDIYRYPNLLGEHNEEVLREIGYSDGEIRRLREAGVIGDTFPQPAD